MADPIETPVPAAVEGGDAKVGNYEVVAETMLLYILTENLPPFNP